jgi:RNA polymerase sigma factor (sigma-70 family)
MRDSEIVAAVVAGDPAGLAAAYDRYAAALYAYCRSLLGEPADAADAVQDTFIVAAAKLAGLRDRDRLRPWLYAVARNECHRRLRARAGAVGLDEVGDVIDETAEVGASAERAELRELVSAAVAGLNPGERELIELNLRHELHGADLADALGVPLNQAHALASRARGQFETSLAALLVARSGRASCAELNDLLAGWDGRLTVLLRKRLNRHIERCDVCGERKRRELRPAMLLGLLPVAMLPDSLRRQVLRLVADDTAQGASYRARVVRRAEPFSPSGFPVPIDPPGPASAPRRYALLAAAAAAMFAVIGGIVIAAGLLQGSGPRAALAPLTTHKVTPTADLQASATASPNLTTAAPTPAPATTSAPTTMVPTTPAPTTPVATTRRSPPATHTPPPTPGTLIAPSTPVTLAQPPAGGPPIGSFTLTAKGGPVTYTITVPGSPVGLTVSQSNGTLAAGKSVTITVTWNSPQTPLSTQLTLAPGGLQVTVSYSPPSPT